MKILFLIGNGFDLHVGLKTAFPDFLKYYLGQPEPVSVDEVGKRYIKRLKEDIRENIELWSDLEVQFGRHTARFGSMGSTVHSLQEELDIVNDDIREKLSAYIAEQDKRSYFAHNAKDVLLRDIVMPEQSLRDFERRMVKHHREKLWHTTPKVVDIITFNYTYTLEHLLGEVPLQTSGFEIHSPVHVHGYYDNRMILGLNDASQIDNEELRKLTDATDVLVKADCNHSYGVGHTDTCNSLIDNAQLICCYGLSFGDTDKMWWQRICSNLARRGEVIVILFSYVPDMPNYANNGPKRQRKMRQVVDMFLTQGGFDELIRQRLMSRVLVSLNDPIFNIQIDDKTPIEQLMSNPVFGKIERSS